MRYGASSSVMTASSVLALSGSLIHDSLIPLGNLLAAIRYLTVMVFGSPPTLRSIEMGWPSSSAASGMAV